MFLLLSQYIILHPYNVYIYLYIYYICLSVFLSFYLSFYLSIYLSIYLSLSLSVCVYVYITYTNLQVMPCHHQGHDFTSSACKTAALASLFPLRRAVNLPIEHHPATAGDTVFNNPEAEWKWHKALISRHWPSFSHTCPHPSGPESS